MCDKKEYGLSNFGKNLTNIRKLRWEQYKKHQNEYPNPYEKFSCCKSQDSLATAIGVERRTIGNWELEKASPTIDKCIELCRILECNIDYLLGAEELVGFSPSVIASHYSGISIDIINYGQYNSDYLDCLNHFMHPDICSKLFNSITLTAWKGSLSKKDLDEINDPLKSKIIKTFQLYQTFTSISNFNKETYKQYILSAIPKHKITFVSCKSAEHINIKACLDNSRFEALRLSNKNDKSYTIFIDYIVDYSFEILTTKAYLDFQKESLGRMFVQVFENYLSE